MIAACALFVLTLLGAPDREQDWQTLRESKDPQAQIAAAKSIVTGALALGECGKVAGGLIDFATKVTTPAQVRNGIAQALAACSDAETAKQLTLRIGGGQEFEKLFLLQAAQGCADEALDRAVRERLLPDKHTAVRVAALALLVRHRSVACVPALEALLAQQRDVELLAPALQALASLRRGTPEWPAFEEHLVELTRHKLSTLRVAALAELAREADGSREDLFVAALDSPDWPARLLAAEWIEKHFTKRGVGALIARLAQEPAESRLRADLARTLLHLTAMPLGDDAQRWAEWWKNSSESFEFPASAGGPRSSSPRKSKAQETSVASRFYGVEVVTQRVIFVIDISGSMLEAVSDVPKDFPGTAAEKPSRIDVAKHELSRIIDQLAPGTLFNIIDFNGGVDAWLDGLADSELGAGGKTGQPASAPRTGPKAGEKPKPPPSEAERERLAKLDAELRARARQYVAKLAAAGGTNLYDALELAFEDPLVDTLFVLSDGQPSAGKETDPAVIRADVQRWNATRKLRIHTVSVGTDFEILRWLAEDSGGEHRFVR